MKTVHVNHLGFRPDDPLKRAVMPVSPDDSDLLGGIHFQVVDASRLIQHLCNSPAWLAALNFRYAQIEQTPLGRFAVCDFGDLSARGGYQILSGAARSYPFLIYRDAWKRCFPLLLEWYRIASCGEAVPGYHEACHLDDCRLRRNGQQVDLVGGWHDAGDLRKWTSTMTQVTSALTWLLDEHGANLPALGLDPDLVWHQLQRGARYLLKTADPVEHVVWHSIASDNDNSCNVWTDNQPNSGDERFADQNTTHSTNETYVRAQAAAARLLRGRDPELARTAEASALAVWHVLAPKLRDHGGAEALVPPALELFLTTRDPQFHDLVVAGLRALLDRQVTAPSFNQDLLTGFFVTNGAIDFNGNFQHRSGRNLFALAHRAEFLARALLLWPADPEAPRWRNGLQTLLEGCLEPMIKRHPYRILPACFYRRGDSPFNGHPLAGDLMFRYFGRHAEGNNRELLETAAALTLAARALAQPRWAAYAQKSLEWVLGFNPHEESMLTGLGYSRGGVFSFYVGQIPGAIINGYLGDQDDHPLLCRQRELTAMLMEYWSVHTAAMLRALSLLENQPLA